MSIHLAQALVPALVICLGAACLICRMLQWPADTDDDILERRLDDAYRADRRRSDWLDDEHPHLALGDTRPVDAYFLQQWFFQRTIDRAESVRSIEQVLRLIGSDEDLEANCSHKEVMMPKSRNDNNVASVRTVSGENECCICLMEYAKGDKIVWAKTGACNHIFHQKCVQKWIKDHPSCPLCRVNLFHSPI